MKVAIYIRVSTDEQAKEGISLEEQQERLVAYCKANGWKDYTLYIDDGYRAKTTTPPEFQRMMGDIFIRAKRIEIVVTTKIDRLTRRLIDLLSFIEELDKYDCHFKSSTESFDTSTPVGRMVSQLLGVFAEFERERNAERVICNAYAKQGTCFYHYTDRDPLEATVINKIKALTESFDYSAKVVKRKSTEALQEELEARLENIEKRSQRQIEAWEKELITDEDLVNAKKQIEKRRKETLEALQKLKQEDSGNSMEKLSSKVKKLSR